ncbi:thiamine biosynthesis lipoprotein ApbE [Planctomycetales bacterium]|nr:thiamine biosynthesis lipoprotein ApbE [Planctomycetales bacterium]
MGTLIRIIFYIETNPADKDKTKEKAEQVSTAVFDKFAELNRVFSDYDSDSEVSQLCSRSTEEYQKNNRCIPLPVSDDLFCVLKESKRIGELSDGAFDISVGPLVRLWRRAKHQGELPKPELSERQRSLTGLHLWHADEKNKTLLLEKSGMRLDFGGIAKGYAADEAVKTALKLGITRILIDAGGDIRVGAAPPADKPAEQLTEKETKCWTVEAGGEFIQLENAAVAGSGSTDKFIEIGGVRYSHIVNPKTGIGLLDSPLVYVIAPTAMEADALASAISVLGAKKGIALIDSQKNTAAKMIYSGDETKIFTSKEWHKVIRR